MELRKVQSGVCMSVAYRAGSRPDTEAIGGYAKSDNAPRRLGGAPVGVPDALALVALPAQVVPFERKYRGFRLLLVNQTRAEAAFEACDSKLYLVCEARVGNGWRAAERLPHLFCGNSRHRVFLPAGSYWEFVAPEYGGPLRTRLRFRLDRKDQPALYSNEFDGAVEPWQLQTR